MASYLSSNEAVLDALGMKFPLGSVLSVTIKLSGNEPPKVSVEQLIDKDSFDSATHTTNFVLTPVE